MPPVGVKLLDAVIAHVAEVQDIVRAAGERLPPLEHVQIGLLASSSAIDRRVACWTSERQMELRGVISCHVNWVCDRGNVTIQGAQTERSGDE